MRIMLSAIAATLLATSPAAAATRNFGVSGFDRVRVDGPFKVDLRTGIAPFARASGSQAALDTVVIEVQGRTLVVRPNRSAARGFTGAVTGPVEIAIGTHDLTSAWLNGAGSLAIDRIKGLSFDLSVQGAGNASVASAAVDQLRVNLFGAAGAKVAGTAARLNATIRGAGTLDASRLATKDATIGAEGSVSVAAAVSATARVQAQGTAVVTLTGRPACTIRALGSATVSGCR
jgi:hypothetical protein